MASEQGIQYKSLDALSAGIATALAWDAILDGEIVHLDADGKPQFLPPPAHLSKHLPDAIEL